MAMIKDTQIRINTGGRMGELPEEFDARRSLTTEQRKEIKRRYDQGNTTMRELAKEYGVSHGLIQFIVYPDRLQPERGFYQRPPKKWAETVRRHRRRKKKILTKLLLGGSNAIG